MKHVLAIILTIMIVISCISVGISEDIGDEGSKVIVTATLLHGRVNPSKKSRVETQFDKGDILEATGKWSDDHHWIEVVGGETGTVWVYADYVNENNSEYEYVINITGSKVKIRSRPFDGKVKAYLNRDKQIRVYRVILGWGKTKKGWIDMRYVNYVKNTGGESE